MAIFYNGVGDNRRMLAESVKLAELGTSIGSRFDEAQGWTHIALAHTRQGRFGEALKYTRKVGGHSAAIGHAMEEHIHQSVKIELYLAVGALVEAERWAESLYAQRESLNPVLLHSYLTQVALAKIATGKMDEAWAILDELLATLPQYGAPSNATIAMAIAYAHLNLAQEKPEALFAGLEERVRPLREAGFIYLLAEEQWLRGQAEMALDQYDAAREALLKARETAEAQEERAVLWQILITSADVEEARGEAEVADRLRDQAREVVSYIAEHAGELRETFLSRPEVQVVLTGKLK